MINEWDHSAIPRISAQRDGVVQPIFDQRPVGPPSPSSALLVERFDLPASDWQTHTLPDQLLTLFLKPGVLRRTLKGGGVSEIPLAPGYVSFSVRETWESACWDHPISVLCVRISDSALQRAARTLIPKQRLDIVPDPRVDDPRLTALMTALDQERARDYSSGRLFVDAVEAAIASLLVRSFNALPPHELPNQGRLHPRRLRRVLEYIEAHLGKSITLEGLAQCIDLSVSHFSHLFRASTGSAPHQFVLNRRIERARALLRDSNLSILEVALAVGFTNQQHLATVFRRFTGVSPSMYRRLR